MRESIGATWIFGIVIVFIIIFTGYLAFSVNYSKAFTLKDEIIDIIEKYSGLGERPGLSLESTVTDVIQKKMTEISYNARGSCYNVANYLYNGSIPMQSVAGVIGKSVHVYAEKAADFTGNNVANGGDGRYNYCIFREDETYQGGTLPGSNVAFTTYRVVVFFSVDIALLNMFSDYYVTGETKNITYPSDEFLHG